MIKWIKKLFKIVEEYDRDKEIIISGMLKSQQRVRDAETEIKKRTAINVDLGRRRSEIIVTGFYKNRDYVQVFQIENEDIESLILTLKEMERYGSVKRVDGEPNMRGFVVEGLERL